MEQRRDDTIIRRAICIAYCAPLLLVALLGRSTLPTPHVSPIAASSLDQCTRGAQLSLAEYREVLAEALHALEEEDVDSAQRLARVKSNLDEVTGVILPTGETVLVEPLLGALTLSGAKDDAMANAAMVRLQTVLSQLDSAVNDNPAARLALLAEVLARPEFMARDTLWQQIERWLIRRIEGWLGQQPASGEPNPLLGAVSQLVAWTLAGLGVVLLAILFGYWLQRILGGFVADAAGQRRNGEDEGAPLTAEEARRRAREEMQSGSYRLAIRQLYLAALLTLEERGVIAYDRSQTNREVLAKVGAHSPMHARLSPVVETFDNVWYGVAEPDSALFESYERQIDDLERSTHP